MRHSVDKSTICITENGEVHGFCSACFILMPLYSYAVFDSKGKQSMRYRCKKSHQKYYEKPSAVSEQKPQPSVTEQTHCALCDGFVRKNRYGARALYAVNGLNQLFCWDCRTILQERVTPKYELRISEILKGQS